MDASLPVNKDYCLPTICVVLVACSACRQRHTGFSVKQLPLAGILVVPVYYHFILIAQIVLYCMILLFFYHN